MSAKALQWAQQQRIASRSLKAVLLVLAGRASSSGVAVVGQETLARDLFITARQVRHHLATLAALGMISREIRSHGAHGRAADAITLTMHKAFDISKANIGHAVGRYQRPRKKTSAWENSQAEVAPPVAQPEENFRANREYISRGSPKPKSGSLGQGARAAKGSARQGDVSASVDGYSQPPEIPPHGKDKPQRQQVSAYARYKTRTARPHTGTVH